MGLTTHVLLMTTDPVQAWLSQRGSPATSGQPKEQIHILSEDAMPESGIVLPDRSAERLPLCLYSLPASVWEEREREVSLVHTASIGL